MLLTPESVRRLQTTVYTDFRSGYSTADVWHHLLSTRVSSTGSQNDYAWMNDLPGMREWVGARVVHNLAASNYSLVNKHFESTIGVNADHIRDDNLGIYAPISQAHGEACAKHPDELLVNLLENGHALECFDGQNFFDTDHPVNPKDASFGVYQNYWSSGKALSQANFEFAMNAMAAFKGEQGKKLRCRGSLLVVPQALEMTGRRILKQKLAIESNSADSAAGVDNLTFGMADLLVIPELTSDTAWYLLDTRKAIKPFVYQTREALRFVTKNRVDDDVVLEENMVKFYADQRDNAGFTLPFLALKLAS